MLNGTLCLVDGAQPVWLLLYACGPSACLAAVVSFKHVSRLSMYFSRQTRVFFCRCVAGVRASAIHSLMPHEMVKADLARFRSGELDVLFNCEVGCHCQLRQKHVCLVLCVMAHMLDSETSSVPLQFKLRMLVWVLLCWRRAQLPLPWFSCRVAWPFSSETHCMASIAVYILARFGATDPVTLAH